MTDLRANVGWQTFVVYQVRMLRVRPIGNSSSNTGARYAVAQIHTIHPDFPQWKDPVSVTLRIRAGRIDVVGIERPTNRA